MIDPEGKAASRDRRLKELRLLTAIRTELTMKRFRVSVDDGQKMVSTGQLLLTCITVEADYYKVEHGTLVFRNNKAGYGVAGYSTYPETVRTFAAGYWRDVTNLGEDRDPVYLNAENGYGR